jgi:NAD(P)-dependent dehydrogenase (short-subunit alcohol dehydrogenase family)
MLPGRHDAVCHVDLSRADKKAAGHFRKASLTMSCWQPPRSMIVTGASSGIGFQTAVQLLRAGVRVMACVGPEASGRPELAELSGFPDCELVSVDLADRQSRADVLLRRLEQDHPWEGVINAAGTAAFGPVERMSPNILDELIQVNFVAPTMIAAWLLPALRTRRHGLVLNVSSGAAVCPLPFAGAYAASKAALESATVSLHHEVRDFGVRVCALRLGKISGTRLSRNALDPSSIGPYAPTHLHAGRTLYEVLWPPDHTWPNAAEVASLILQLATASQTPNPIYEFGADLKTSRDLAVRLHYCLHS